MEAQRIEVASGGAQLSVSVWASDGPTILALHPGVADSRVWRWCAPRWADAGCRVVTYDRRGFGSTRYLPEPHDDLIDLMAVIDATEAGPALVVGNSQGGGLAIDLALSHPDIVAGMVLLSPAPSGYDTADWPTTPAEAEQDGHIEAAEEAGDLELLNRLEVRYWLDGVDQPEGRVTGEARELMLEMNGLALRVPTAGEVLERPPAWPRIGDISAPTLAAVGEFDLPGLHRICEELARSVRSGRFVVIPGSAHCPSLDRPDEVNRIVTEFAASLGR